MILFLVTIRLFKIVICLSCCPQYQLSILQLINIPMNQPTQKQLQINRIINQAFDVNQVTTLSELTKYTKMLGSYLLRGIQTFAQLFKKNLQQRNVYNEARPTPEKEIEGDEKSQLRRVGFKVNFSEFSCKEQQIDAFKLNDSKQPQTKPLRTFRFSPEDLQDEQSLQMSQKEDLSFFFSRIGSKRTKKDEVSAQLQEPPQPFCPQTAEIQEHWRKIYNQVNQEWAVAVSNLKDKNQKERKKNVAVQDPTYRQYIKAIGKDLSQTITIGEPNKRLIALVKGKRQREKVEMRPPRKYTHIEKETPQIYSVKRVLEVLDQQKEELMQEKRKKLEEALRAQRQARRLEQEARERQRRALQEQLQAQRRQQEQRARKEKEALEKAQKEQPAINETKPQLADQKKQELANGGLTVIQQREELNSEIGPEQELGVSGLAMKRNRNIQITDNKRIQPAVSPVAQQEKKPEEAQPQKNQLFSTPTKEEHKPEQKGSIPALSDQKRKVNPFIKTTPPPTLSLQELIKNDVKPTPFQAIMSTTSSTNLFAQPSSVSNLFGAQTPQQQKQEPAQQLYNSPTSFMNNPIRSSFPQNPVSSGQFLTQFGSPNSLVNNQTSSFQSSNANSSFGNEGVSFNQQAPQSSASSLFQTGSLGLGMFTNNPNAVKLFQSNMFMSQAQPRSLFGESSSQSARDYSSQRQAGRSKKAVRIS